MMDPWISSSLNSNPEAFFAAYGRTEDEARAALNRGLDEYRRQLGARVDPAWVDEAKAEAEFKTVSLGRAIAMARCCRPRRSVAGLSVDQSSAPPSNRSSYFVMPPKKVGVQLLGAVQ